MGALLERAKTTHLRQSTAEQVTPDDIELALAVIRGEITPGQAMIALNMRSASSFYAFAFRVFRAYIRRQDLGLVLAAREAARKEHTRND